MHKQFNQLLLVLPLTNYSIHLLHCWLPLLYRAVGTHAIVPFAMRPALHVQPCLNTASEIKIGHLSFLIVSHIKFELFFLHLNVIWGTQDLGALSIYEVPGRLLHEFIVYMRAKVVMRSSGTLLYFDLHICYMID